MKHFLNQANPILCARGLRRFILLAFLFAGWAPAVAHGASREYELKAAFLYKFTNYIEWDSSAKAADRKILCIAGEDPFDGVLERLVEINDPGFRQAEVRYPKSSRELASCHLVFVSRSLEGDVDRFLDAASHLPIVTVSDIPRFARRGGMIELVLEQSSIRFVINQARAREQNIRLSAQLLALAKETITEAGR